MKLSRPPFILAFPGDMSGCGYHRIIRPLQILGRTGMAAGRAEGTFPSEHVAKAMKPDVMVWQRQTEANHLEIMDRYRAALPDCYFVFEIDDALSAVPEASWHNPFMTPNIDAKLAAAIAKMDVVTVTTQDLADHMRKLAGSSIPIRVLPNMIGRDDLEIATKAREEVKKNLNPTEAPKLFRIGFGGGVSHTGDLALLNDVFKEFKDEVEWCFLGMNPEIPPEAKKTFFGGVAPNHYLPSLAALNVDLIIAPLEDNLFNRCKSNLRLIESGACGYPVIASPVAPYLTDNPPVLYCNTPSEWIETIRKFMHKTPEERARHGEKMRDWVKSRYILDDLDKAEKRLLGWLPDRTRVFKPKLNSKGTSVRFVSTPDELRSAFETTEDILYARPGTMVSQPAKERLLKVDLDVACCLTNDGGPWGFPDQNKFTPTESAAMEGIMKATGDLKDAQPILLASASGPAVLMRRSALDVVGLPDIDSFSVEVAILEWSCGVKARGMKVGLCPSVFVGVPQPLVGSPGEAESATLRITSRWPTGPSDEVALKSLREHLEIAFHRDCYRSLPPAERNNYAAWIEFCDTRGPASLNRAQEWAETNPRPDIVTLNYPSKIDWEACEEAEWLFFVPEGAILPGDYRELLFLAIEENPKAALIYGDHDFTFQNRARMNPDFKPNFDLHMLLCRDYVTQAMAIRKEAFRDELGLRADEMIDETVLYDLALRVVENYGRESIGHLPHVVATLQPMTIEILLQHGQNKRDCAKQFCERVGWNIDIEDHPTVPMIRSPLYAKRIKGSEPFVSIIIPCKDNVEMLAPCIATILKMTDYPKDRFEIVIMDNGSTRAEMVEYLASLKNGENGQNAANCKNPPIRIISHPKPYNWAEINNVATRQYAKGDYLCFLNDDTRVMSLCWLSEMVGCASLPDVGAVGARLIYPTGQVQHVGVVAHAGLTAHLHKGLPVNQPGTNAYAIVSHECTAVTGACLVVERKKFESVNGFYEGLPTNFNDVAFCQDLFFKKGLRNVLSFKSELQHFEGVTRNAGGLTPEAWQTLMKEGQILARIHPEKDPYWNPNLMIAYIQDGHVITGTDLQSFRFPVDPLPWSITDIDRVLLIGDPSAVTDELHDQASLYRLEVWGNTASITAPPMRNCGPWDIRRPDIAKQAFARLGLSRVVMTQLGESPIQLLSFLRRLDIPIEYRPIDAEAVCPRTNFTPNGQSCGAGYKNGKCQSCMDEYSSPHGNVLIPAWLSEWVRFTQAPVRVDLSRLTNPEYREALEFVYAGGAGSGPRESESP